MKIPPQQVSESVRKLNPHLYPCACPQCEAREDVRQITTKRIRQSTKPLLNKLEQEWLQYAHIRFHAWTPILGQMVGFRLGNGVTYWPDFISFHGLSCWEVKGNQPIQDDSVVKIKVAASIYRSVTWILTWKVGTNWVEQIVRP